MAVRCTECGGNTAWHEDASSAICTTCGTLVDPSQSTLTSHIGQSETSTQFNSSLTFTLKSFRHAGWNLTGQGKEARYSQQAHGMHEFIKSLASALLAPGLSPRTINLFTQVMAATQSRWGRKAKLVAGACLAIALRESKRPDLYRDIAFILGEPPSLLNRTITASLSSLNMQLPPATPSLYISDLQSHLSAIFDPARDATNLPPTLMKFLKPLSMTSVIETATSLCELLSRSGNTDLLHLPTAATACALVILAIEAEARNSVIQLSELAQSLASPYHFKKGVVMSRYKVVQNIVSPWIDEVPWLDKYIKRSSGRANLAQRVVVARGLKDVIKFRDSIWRQKLEAVKRHTSAHELENDVGEIDKSSDAMVVNPSSATAAQTEFIFPPRKRRKTQSGLVKASRFLLDPLAGTPTSLRHRSLNSSESSVSTQSWSELGSHMDYLLSTSPSTLDLCKPCTRLQMLSATRGGEDEIQDDELFAPGEWESMLRSEDERLQLLRLWEQEEVSFSEDEDTWDTDQDDSHKHSIRSSWNRSCKLTSRTPRINKEAFERFMSLTEDEKGGDETWLYGLDMPSALHPGDSEEEDTKDAGGVAHCLLASSGQDSDGIVVDEWRPVSPTFHHSDYLGDYDGEELG